jgi:calcineurin-like phosphoesterase family protein
MTTWFVSDTHFFHGNIIKYSARPFLNTEDQAELDRLGGQWHNGSWKGKGSSNYQISQESIEIMNDHLVDQINSKVGKRDTLYHLGDFAFGPQVTYRERVKALLDRLICKNIHIIWGNHDRLDIGDLFISAQHYKEISVNRQKIMLSHYAHAVWNRSHRASWQLYGHSHGAAEEWMDTHMPGRRSIDVGVDNAAKILGEYRPFSFDELNDILGSRKGFSMDHHIPKNYQGPSEETLLDRYNK